MNLVLRHFESNNFKFYIHFKRSLTKLCVLRSNCVKIGSTKQLETVRLQTKMQYLFLILSGNSMNDLYNLFKEINSTNDSHDPKSENLNFSIDNDDGILNCHISENEILKCINNLKNNKAC